MAARAPGGFVLAAVDSRRFRQHLSYVADGLGVALPIVLLVTAGLGWLLARGSLRPIQRMTHTARRISGANLDEKVPTSGSGDELDQLAVTLNEMITRIRESMARIRRFSGDAAHEIRTPLAAIRSQIEVTLELPRSREEYDQVLRQVLDEVDRLGRGADAILRLATSEAGLQRSQRSAVDLAELLADLIAFFEPLAAEKDVKLSLALEPTPAVMGDPAWLHQLFANLVHNAIKFTPPGGSVRVELSQEPEVHAIAVAVRDTGVGIPREHLDRIFERFHKVDASRTEGGFGLGLSLAREIAKAHGGTIHVESEPGRGSVFRVLLPLEEGDEGSPD
jgi:heavy metal sensor kinase